MNCLRALGKWWRRMSRRRRIGLAVLAAAAVLLSYWAILPYRAPEWTGFGPRHVYPQWEREKKLWDWLELLIVPAALAGGALMLNWTQRTIDRQAEDARSQREMHFAEMRLQDDRLRMYFDSIADLLVNALLRRSGYHSEQRVVARTRTAIVLSTLDGRRKGLVVRYLSGLGLIGRYSSMVHLGDADLSGADLRDTDLHDTDLRGVNLTGADVTNEQLAQAKSLKGATMPNGTLFEGTMEEFRERVALNTDKAP